MDKGLITAFVIVIVLIGIGLSAYRATKRKKQYEAKITSGTKTSGRIYAVKPQSSHATHQYPISVKLSYDATAETPKGNVITQVSRVAPNLHPYIAEPVGVSSIGLGGVKIIRQRHQQMKEYREKLKAQGKTSEEINRMAMDIAVKMANAKPGGVEGIKDDDGYLLLEKPVEVDVYVYEGEATIVFKPELVDEYFKSQNYFEI